MFSCFACFLLPDHLRLCLQPDYSQTLLQCPLFRPPCLPPKFKASRELGLLLRKVHRAMRDLYGAVQLLRRAGAAEAHVDVLSRQVGEACRTVARGLQWFPLSVHSGINDTLAPLSPQSSSLRPGASASHVGRAALRGQGDADAGAAESHRALVLSGHLSGVCRLLLPGELDERVGGRMGSGQAKRFERQERPCLQAFTCDSSLPPRCGLQNLSLVTYGYLDGALVVIMLFVSAIPRELPDPFILCESRTL